MKADCVHSLSEGVEFLKRFSTATNMIREFGILVFNHLKLVCNRSRPTIQINSKPMSLSPKSHCYFSFLLLPCLLTKTALNELE